MIKSPSRGGLVRLPPHSTQAPGGDVSSHGDVFLARRVQHRVREVQVPTGPSTIRGHEAPGAMASAQRESWTPMSYCVFLPASMTVCGGGGGGPSLLSLSPPPPQRPQHAPPGGEKTGGFRARRLS